MAVKHPLAFVAECPELESDLTLIDEYERLDEHLFTAEREAREFWPEIDLDEGDRWWSASTTPGPSCRREQILSALDQAKSALVFHAKLVKALTNAMYLPSAWIGPLRLCRENVEYAELTPDRYSGRPALVVTLAAEPKRAWAKITKLSVGRELPVRLDGAIISRPGVNERVDSGVLQISGLQSDTLSRIAARVAEPC